MNQHKTEVAPAFYIETPRHEETPRNLDNLKRGDIIIRRVTNAKRMILATIDIEGKHFVISQYLNSTNPRIDCVNILYRWDYELVTDMGVIVDATNRWNAKWKR